MKIEDYGFLSDTQTAALVGRNGSVDWLCFPRFDSAACFAALLGEPKNGRWLIAPADESAEVTRRYRGHTLILETTFETKDGAVRLIDFMPPRGTNPDIVRIVEGVRGKVALRMELIIRFDYGDVVPWVRKCGDGLEAIAGPNALVLRTPIETRGEDLTTVAEFELAKGERVPFVLTWYQSHENPPRAIHPEHALRETEKYWRDWAGCCEYRGKWNDAVVRSLVTLKGLTYAPTGGIVAAATTSLPEKIGSVRNWDYRYCWLRDATFTLFALTRGGFCRGSTFVARLAFARYRGQSRANADSLRHAWRTAFAGVRNRMAGGLRKFQAGASRQRGLESISAGRLWRSDELDVSRATGRHQNRGAGLGDAKSADEIS